MLLSASHILKSLCVLVTSLFFWSCISNSGTISLSSIAVTPIDGDVDIAETLSLTATVTYVDGSTADMTSSVIWISSDTTVATISGTGVATGVSVGSTTLTATLDGISSDDVTLFVHHSLVSIAVVTDSNIVKTGFTQTFTATGTYSDDSTDDISTSVTWRSSDTDIATITDEGVATGVSVGSCTLSASLGDVFSDDTTLVVEPLLAYIGNLFGDTVLFCVRNPTTGTLSDCEDSGVGAIFDHPIGISTSFNNAFFYVANSGNDTVTVCTFDTTLSNCMATGSSLNQPTKVTLNTDNTHAYVVNSANSTVVLCNVDSIDGTLSGCSTTGSGFLVPEDLYLNTAGTHAYITDTSLNRVLMCEVNESTAALEDCADSGAEDIFETPINLVLNGDETFAYISNNGSGLITLCKVDDTTGELSDCQNSGNESVLGLEYIALNETNTQLYLTRAFVFFGSLSNVYTCNIASEDGTLTNCEDAADETITDLNAPVGLILR